MIEESSSLNQTPINQKRPKDKKVEKVVSGEVKTRKASTSKKLADVFLAEDVADAKSYILWDVVIPIIKDGIGVTFHSAIDAIFGTSKYRRDERDRKTNYTRYSYKDDRDRRRYDDRRRDSYRTYGYDDIILDNRGEAEVVLDSLNDIIEEYGLVSVGDYYELTGVPSNFQDNKYGWTSLRNAQIERCMGGGYRIRLPKAMPLD